MMARVHRSIRETTAIIEGGELEVPLVMLKNAR